MPQNCALEWCVRIAHLNCAPELRTQMARQNCVPKWCVEIAHRNCALWHTRNSRLFLLTTFPAIFLLPCSRYLSYLLAVRDMFVCVCVCGNTFLAIFSLFTSLAIFVLLCSRYFLFLLPTSPAINSLIDTISPLSRSFHAQPSHDVTSVEITAKFDTCTHVSIKGTVPTRARFANKMRTSAKHDIFVSSLSTFLSSKITMFVLRFFPRDSRLTSTSPMR